MTGGVTGALAVLSTMSLPVPVIQPMALACWFAKGQACRGIRTRSSAVWTRWPIC